MPRVARRDQHASHEARSILRNRLEGRRVEIEQAVQTRCLAISDPTEVSDPRYAAGLRTAIAAALGFALDGVEGEGARHPAAIPVALLVQARLAARCGVGIDTVLRRYFAGYSLLSDFIIDEAEKDGLMEAAVLKGQLREGSMLFDRLVSAIVEEYAREGTGRPVTTEELRKEQVERLLNGELIDVSPLRYDLDAVHLGVIASGKGSPKAIRELCTRLDCNLLLVAQNEETTWAWLGRRNGLNSTDLQSGLTSIDRTDMVIALGEPGEGLRGWRRTHRQAEAAFAIASRSDTSLARYGDVALLAAALRDDLLHASLRELYVAPLYEMRDGGVAGRETLRAYFHARRNVSATAAALGISRQAVNSRLRAVEERIGRSIDDCVGEMQTAMRIEDLTESTQELW